MAIYTAFNRLPIFLVDILFYRGDYDGNCWVMEYGDLFCSI